MILRRSPFPFHSLLAVLALYGSVTSALGATVVRRSDAHGHGAKSARGEAPVELFHLTTHATYTLRPDRRSGSFSPPVMRAMRQLLRCHHTGMRHAISRRLIEVLYATARHFHSSKVYIVAGYRAPRVARKKGNPRSPHKRGVACDFRLETASIEAVRDYLRTKWHDIGVGYYPNSGFIHVDVERRKPAYWIDYSAPGERARYAQKAPAAVEEEARTETEAAAETETETE